MDLATSLVLIVLAFAEDPATPPFKVRHNSTNN